MPANSSIRPMHRREPVVRTLEVVVPDKLDRLGEIPERLEGRCWASGDGRSGTARPNITMYRVGLASAHRR